MDVRQSKIVSYLASYAGTKATPQFGQLELRRDLQLEPLDLVLFGLDLEQSADSPFPFESLDHVKTVSDLLLVVMQWLADEARAAHAEDPEAALDELEDREDWKRATRADFSAASKRSSTGQAPST